MNKSDFSGLRAAAAIRAPRAFVDRELLVALLAERDQLRASAQPIAVKREYPEDFEQCWAAYPKRPGASKSASYKAWAGRLKAGATTAEMLVGTKKYAAYVQATWLEPRFVLQPATFYGPSERFSADWTIPKVNMKGPQHGRIRDQDFGAGAGDDGRF